MTNALKWVALSAAMMIGTTALVTAADAPAKLAPAKDAPAKVAPKKEKAKPIHLVKPWSGLTTLTDDQKTKINGLHVAALEEISKIDAKEKDDIMAVLTDEQKKELDTIAENEKAAKKAASHDTKKDAKDAAKDAPKEAPKDEPRKAN